MIIVLQSYSFFTTFAIVIIVFCCVSPYLANHVLQVSQIRVGQGFANTSFAVLHLLRKISNVSQIRVSQGFTILSFARICLASLARF